MEDLQSYLDSGKLPSEDPLEQMVNKVRSLPLKDIAQLAVVCNETLAQRLSGLEVG